MPCLLIALDATGPEATRVERSREFGGSARFYLGDETTLSR